MQPRHYMTCLWPGLPELWWRGQLSNLPMAIGFAFGLNALLVLRSLLPAWLNPTLVWASWWIGVFLWIACTLRQIRSLPRLLAPRTVVDSPDRFPEANQAFLRGDWKLAESRLLDVLAVEPRDPPALLLLSSVYRHTDRPLNAKALLSEMRRLEACDPWHVEIAAEQLRLDRMLEASNPEESEGSDAAELTAA